MRRKLPYISLIVGFLLMIVTGILTDMELITPFSTDYGKIKFTKVKEGDFCNFYRNHLLCAVASTDNNMWVKAQ